MMQLYAALYPSATENDVSAFFEAYTRPTRFALSIDSPSWMMYSFYMSKVGVSVGSYVLPARTEGDMRSRKLPVVPSLADVPPYPFFRMIVEHWQEIMDRTDGHCIYRSGDWQSMTACEHASEALYEWVGEHEEDLVDVDGSLAVSDLSGYEGNWAGDLDLRHVWLEAWVRDPRTKKYHRWVIDPTANQFALEETYGYNDPRPLVIMPAKGPRYKTFYKNKSALDDFDTSSF